MKPRQRFSRRLDFETLEDRTLPTAYLVDTLIDNPSGGVGDTDGMVSLREAITAANTNATFGDAAAGEGGGVVDSIAFKKNLTGKTLVLGGTELTISDHLSLIGLGKSSLTINGNDSSRVLSVNAGVSATISKLMITGGAASVGGGIYNQGTLTIDNTTLLANSASFGGGVVNDYDAKMTIINSNLTQNTASAGGAVGNDGILQLENSVFSANTGDIGAAVWNDGVLNINLTTFADNTSEGNGGAISNRFPGEVMIMNSVFKNNYGDASGGAIDNFGGFSGPYSPLTIVNTEFVGNSAGTGGAIWNNGPATISGSTFTGNSVRVFGGAIAHRRSSLSIENNAFSNNAALIGGAIDISSRAPVSIHSSALWANTAVQEGGAIENFGGTLTIENSTLSGNSSDGQGGGIWNLGNLVLTNATLTANKANWDGVESGEGGGIYHRAVGIFDLPNLNNTIVAGNTSGASGSETPDDINGLVDLFSSHNLIGDADTAGGLTHNMNGNIVGNNGVGTMDISSILDPNLADNGGPTPTHALLAGSLAIDAGDNALAAGISDQRGAPRIHDGDGNGIATVDIGAYEYVSSHDLIAVLHEDVESLGNDGVLSPNQVLVLLTLLEQAQTTLDDANPIAAVQTLTVFGHKVEHYVELGVLSETEGNKLTATADIAIQGIQSTSMPGVGINQLFSHFHELLDLRAVR